MQHTLSLTCILWIHEILQLSIHYMLQNNSLLAVNIFYSCNDVNTKIYSSIFISCKKKKFTEFFQETIRWKSDSEVVCSYEFPYLALFSFFCSKNISLCRFYVINMPSKRCHWLQYIVYRYHWLTGCLRSRSPHVGYIGTDRSLLRWRDAFCYHT